MTIEQMIEVPVDRQITFDIPPVIPVGANARLEIVFSQKTETINNIDATLDKIWELCKDSSISVDNFFEMRNRDKELEEKKFRDFFSGKNG